MRIQASLTSGSQTGTGQALTRGMVRSAKFLLLQHLSRGEHRRGSVGGARHGIGQFGTGDLSRGVALAVVPTRDSRAYREGDRGIEGDLPTWATNGCRRPDRSDAACWIEIHLASKPDIPLDPPIPLAGQCSRPQNGKWLSAGADPFRIAQVPQLPGEAGGAGLVVPRTTSRFRDDLVTRHRKSKLERHIPQQGGVPQ